MSDNPEQAQPGPPAAASAAVEQPVAPEGNPQAGKSAAATEAPGPAVDAAMVERDVVTAAEPSSASEIPAAARLAAPAEELTPAADAAMVPRDAVSAKETTLAAEAPVNAISAEAATPAAAVLAMEADAGSGEDPTSPAEASARAGDAGSGEEPSPPAEASAVVPDAGPGEEPSPPTEAPARAEDAEPVAVSAPGGDASAMEAAFGDEPSPAGEAPAVVEAVAPHPAVREPDEDSLRLAEALVFASAEPVTPRALARVLADDVDPDAVLALLRVRYAGRGVELVDAGPGVMFRSAVDLAPRLRKVIESPRRLPRVAMETLAIVAYHQPMTRAEIEHIRGTALSQQTLDSLLELNLIAPKGRRETPGRPTLWGTTPEFLAHFGLKDIRELPRREDLLLETAPPRTTAEILPEDLQPPADANPAEEPSDGA